MPKAHKNAASLFVSRANTATVAQGKLLHTIHRNALRSARARMATRPIVATAEVGAVS